MSETLKNVENLEAKPVVEKTESFDSNKEVAAVDEFVNKAVADLTEQTKAKLESIKGKEGMPPHLVGLSLSGCIKDIIKGEIQKSEILKIISGTNAGSLEEFKKLLENYEDNVWQYAYEKGKDGGKEGSKIALELYEAGIIEQPRLTGGQPPIGTDKWVEADKLDEWKKNQPVR